MPAFTAIDHPAASCSLQVEEKPNSDERRDSNASDSVKCAGANNDLLHRLKDVVNEKESSEASGEEEELRYPTRSSLCDLPTCSHYEGDDCSGKEDDSKLVVEEKGKQNCEVNILQKEERGFEVMIEKKKEKNVELAVKKEKKIFEVTIEKKKEENLELKKDKETSLDPMFEKENREKSKAVNPSKNRNNAEEEKEEVEGMDSGWSYMVLVGTFITMVIVAIVGPGFGILFSDFLLERKTSSTITTAIFNTESFSWSISNLLAGALTEHFGCRPVALVGGLLCFFGTMASAFAPSAYFLFFSFSFMTGFGSGSSCIAVFAVIPQYFRRTLGRANGLTMVGLCMGGIIGPPLVTFLQEQFSFKGATLIVSGMALHICVSAVLYRPTMSTKAGKMPASQLGVCELMKRLLRTVARNCLYLRLTRVIISAFSSSFIVIVFLNLSLLVPFVMEEKGHTQETAAWCLSVSNFGNLLARLVIAACSDMAWFNVLYIFIVFAIILGASMIAFSLLQEVLWITVALGISGFSIGVCFTLHLMIIAQYLGMQLYVGVIGVGGIVNSLWILVCGPLLGVIRDWSGSYTLSICMLGASGFIAAALAFLMPAAVVYDKRKEEKQRTKDAEMGG